MKRFFSILFFAVCALSMTAQEQEGYDYDFKRILNDYFNAYSVEGYRYRHTKDITDNEICIDDSLRRITIHASESFCNQPLTPKRVLEIEQHISYLLPMPYNLYGIHIINNDSLSLEDLIPNYERTDSTTDLSRVWADIDHRGNAWMKNISRPYEITGGLEGRHIMIWPSHGRYYKEGKWEWQRPYLFCTTEDLFTQSIVLPYLFPMLENAGAIVCDPRERDVQTAMVVVDNDAENDDGTYKEDDEGGLSWTTTEKEGFKPKDTPITDDDKPFSSGTARKIGVTSKREDAARAIWTPNIPRDGHYAVYVSYQTLPTSIDDAHYTVYHKGGCTEFIVNQQMGGGTWLYLGTFEFESGKNRHSRVELSNYSTSIGEVTADAVRFGGGMSLVSRGSAGVSGLPRFIEAARYNTQYSGLPYELFTRGNTSNDYNADIACRPNFLNYLGGGSVFMPQREGLKVPFELSVAVHSDAGYRADNGVFGSLTIGTSTGDGGAKHFSSGLSRYASADFANMMLKTMTEDMSGYLDMTWTRREMWDKNYGETRIPDVPSTILEFMSHQNYGDLKYAHDPYVKFLFGRCFYKGILKFINFQHGISDFALQPLPVKNFSAQLSNDGKEAILRWEPTIDKVDSTANPTCYIVYTKRGDGSFDNGIKVEGTSTRITISKGVQFSFKVQAYNKGGVSFPSEVLSVYSSKGASRKVLIVNGFNRISGPARIETPDSIGFDLNKDMGVPYIYNASYCGPQTNFKASAGGSEGPAALGYSDNSMQGKVFAGNTFDYPYVHGKAIVASDMASFESCSRGSLEKGEIDLKKYAAIDFIAGLQKDVHYNMQDYSIFTPSIRQQLETYTRGGGNIFISGSYIASNLTKSEDRDFAYDVLHYTHADTLFADFAEDIKGLGKTIPIYRTPNDIHYAAVDPDVVMPADDAAFSAFAYAEGHSAGIAYNGKDYKVIATGFPFECIKEEKMRATAMRAILKFLFGK